MDPCTMTSAWFTPCHYVDLCGWQHPSSACLTNMSSTESLHWGMEGLELDSPNFQNKTSLNRKIKSPSMR